MHPKNTPLPNPSGLCQCGCGQITARARQNDPRRGWVAREHIRFVSGHNTPRPDYGYTVDPDTGCWNFNGNINRDGYGMMAHRGSSFGAHCVYYELAFGPVPEGLELDHTCQNRRCCNPDHLEPVTHTENVRRGRNVKMTKEMRDRAWTLLGTKTNREIALELGVSPFTIKDLFRGKTWKDAA